MTGPPALTGPGSAGSTSGFGGCSGWAESWGSMVEEGSPGSRLRAGLSTHVVTCLPSSLPRVLRRHSHPSGVAAAAGQVVSSQGESSRPSWKVCGSCDLMLLASVHPSSLHLICPRSTALPVRPTRAAGPPCLRLHRGCQAWFQLTLLRSPPSEAPDRPAAPPRLTSEGLALRVQGWLRSIFAGSPIVPVPARALLQWGGCFCGCAPRLLTRRDPILSQLCPKCPAGDLTPRRGRTHLRGRHWRAVCPFSVGSAEGRGPGCVCVRVCMRGVCAYVCTGPGAGSVCNSGTCQKTCHVPLETGSVPGLPARRAP